MELFDGVAGVDPGGVDEVAQLDGAGGEPLGGEGFALGRACGIEGAGLFELIGLLHQRMGVVQVVEVAGPLVVDDVRLGGGDQRGDVGELKVGSDEGALELRVDVGPVQPLY